MIRIAFISCMFLSNLLTAEPAHQCARDVLTLLEQPEGEADDWQIPAQLFLESIATQLTNPDVKSWLKQSIPLFIGPTAAPFSPPAKRHLMTLAGSSKCKSSKGVKGLFLTPESQKREVKNIIYMFTDTPREFGKINLRGRKISKGGLKKELAVESESGSSIDAISRYLVGEQSFRYIGLTSQTMAQRFSGHLQSAKADSGRRSYTPLKVGKMFVQVIIENAHPQQLKTLEAYFIRLFQANSGMGINSNSGLDEDVWARESNAAAVNRKMAFGDDPEALRPAKRKR